MSIPQNDGLMVDKISVAFDAHQVLHDLSLTIKPHVFTAILGPNGCGKSTLLRTLARVQKPSRGTARLDGQPLAHYPNRALARRIGFLPQSPVAPVTISVEELVARGRTPHTSLLKRWGKEDDLAVKNALLRTDLTGFAKSALHSLSGGQRQRAWIAMVLAQEADILLLDEPTTFLDINHQLEVMKLVQGLTKQGKTVVAVLHDLNLTARFADQVVLMHDGRVSAQGVPAKTLTPDNIQAAFQLKTEIMPDPLHATPLVLYH